MSTVVSNTTFRRAIIGATAHEMAASYLSLDLEAHRDSKRRARAALLADVAAGIDLDFSTGVAG